MTENNTQLAASTDMDEITPITVQNITGQEAGAMITSFKSDSTNRAQAVKVFNAMNNPSEKIADHINEVIEVRDFLIEMTSIEQQDAYGNPTGEYDTVPRCVFVSPDGTAYQSVSKGMANVIRNMITCAGMAPWEPPIQLKIKQISVGRGSMLTADMVG